MSLEYFANLLSVTVDKKKGQGANLLSKNMPRYHVLTYYPEKTK
jgi:hypothetical protein